MGLWKGSSGSAKSQGTPTSRRYAADLHEQSARVKGTVLDALDTALGSAPAPHQLTWAALRALPNTSTERTGEAKKRQRTTESSSPSDSSTCSSASSSSPATPDPPPLTVQPPAPPQEEEVWFAVSGAYLLHRLATDSGSEKQPKCRATPFTSSVTARFRGRPEAKGFRACKYCVVAKRAR